MLQNYNIHHHHHTMKPISSLRNGGTSKSPRYSVHFDDGITLIVKTVNDKLCYDTMLSVGLDTYYLKKGKWPTGKNLEKRMELAIQFINKNVKNNRYRKKQNLTSTQRYPFHFLKNAKHAIILPVFEHVF